MGFLQSSRKLGILYTNPCIDPDQALAESSGRWEQSPFDQTVVMTSSRSSNLPLKSGNSVEVPQGIMSEYVNYSMYAELLKGRICQSRQLSDPTLAQNRRFCCVCAKKTHYKTTTNHLQHTLIALLLYTNRFLSVICNCVNPLALNCQCDIQCGVIYAN